MPLNVSGVDGSIVYVVMPSSNFEEKEYEIDKRIFPQNDVSMSSSCRCSSSFLS